MYRTQILIISERKELAIKYKKLINNLNQEVIYTSDLAEAIGIIQKEKIEFIIISDTIKEKLSDFIRKVRALTYNFRPIIIAISKSSDLKDKIEILEQGADDILGEEISKQEFQVRFKAHLRRYIESFLNPITHLSDKNITIKALEQSLNDKNDYSYILVKLKGSNLYQKTHGEIAWEKAIKTLGAMINSAISKDDFAGHLSDSEFILIVNPMAAENIASFLAFAFDNVLDKFYSEDEFKNNFSLSEGDETKEIRKGLMRLNISSCDKASRSDYKDIINNLNDLIKAIKQEKSSAYIIDRARLCGSVTPKEKNRVLIYEKDCALSYLLKNVCELNSIQSEIAQDEEEFDALYKSYRPDVVILDWGSKDGSQSLKIAKRISNDGTKLIFSSSYLNKKEILKAGADLYMPKPYEVDEMVEAIKKFLS